MDLNTTRRIQTLVLFYYQGAGKHPAAQEKKERAALGPKGREQLNKPADAARFFFFFPASTI